MAYENLNWTDYISFTFLYEIMDFNDVTKPLKRLRHHYRLVVMNEDTYEEVVKFKLTRASVYITLSTIFVVLVAATASLIIFTPLKFYLPGVGYGNAKQIKEYRILKLRTDSMEKAMQQQSFYLDQIDKVLRGKMVTRDTQSLPMPKLEDIDQ
jgi:hypothetical protein